MIKQVYQVQVNERFGYVDTLEQAKELEETFMFSYSTARNAVNSVKDLMGGNK